jgi:hypothetical protein
MKSISVTILSFVGMVLFASCASQDPQPPRPRLSSMPQNLPQSWEGQSAMGGMPMSY